MRKETVRASLGEHGDLLGLGVEFTRDDVIRAFRRDGISADGVLMKPMFQATALKAAREELSKAIAIIERTK